MIAIKSDSHRFLFFLVTALSVVFMAGTGLCAVNDLKLKSGAEGKLCLKCHEEFDATVKRSHTHPLVKDGECTGCHTPHTSMHGSLLTTGPQTLCYDCHKEVLPDNARSVHEIVVAGDCLKCHDPHGSDYPKTLLKPGNELCLECHRDISGDTGDVRFRHPPLYKERGCLNCHNSHASTRLGKLLKSEAPALCSQCHNEGKPSFLKKHMNFEVSASNCTSCHNPHGSDQKGLIYNVVHRPLEEKKCIECHRDRSNPGALVGDGLDAALCGQCHKDMIDRTMGKKRVHRPLLEDTGCRICHNPHASRQAGLTKGPAVDLCGACHADTVELQELYVINFGDKKLCEPVKTGECVVCHSPHASDFVLHFETESNVELCGRCHAWQTHSTHPIGEKVIDNRNRNLTLDCISCHRGCGTSNYSNMLSFPTTYDLCVSCHEDRRR